MLVTLLFLSAAAQTAQPSSKPAPSSSTVQQPAAKMECRNVTEAGSRIPSRVCKLHEEWEAMAKATQDDLRSSRNQHGEAINPE